MMLVLVVLLTVLLVAVVVFAGILYLSLEDWRIRCLVAERERDQLREQRDDLRRFLAGYERITGIAEATVRAMSSRVGR